MGEVLGIGISHYPGFIYADHEMSMRVKQTITSPKVPEALKDPRNWPAPMQAEWGADEGTAFAAKHRQEFVDSVREARKALVEFDPDLVIIFGDDQYENFKDDIIPPFCVFIADEFQTRPFLRGRGGAPTPNVWEEPYDKLFVTSGHRQAAKLVTSRLLESGFDMPYSYQFHHMDGLGHAFINTMLYLDYDREGWKWPVVPIAINAYGRNVVSGKGLNGRLFTQEEVEYDPPSPSPKRVFELGANVAKIMKESPWRAAVIGSSSWSHAFLTEKNDWIFPDIESDRARFEELKAANYTAWRDLSLDQLEANGEQELLNWIPLAGAMHQLDMKPRYIEFIESWLMNSCKCVAVFPPR
jgi:hypothetical protein